MPKHPYDRFDLYEFLKTVVTRQPDGFCAYKGEWSDSKVARQYGIHRQTVGRIRAAQFGPLEDPMRLKPTEPDTSAGIPAAVAGFEHRLARLESNDTLPSQNPPPEIALSRSLTALETRLSTLERRFEAFEISIDILTRRHRRAARKQKARKP